MDELTKAAAAVVVGWKGAVPQTSSSELDTLLAPFDVLIDNLAACLKRRDDAALERARYEALTRYGRRVRVTRLGSNEPFVDQGARTFAAVGAVGVLVAVASSHRECVQVQHDEGSFAWYDLSELEDA